MDKHFPPTFPYHKLFNRKNVKVGYSCCPNMNTIIKSHNKKVLNPSGAEQSGGCNCLRENLPCPLQGQCLKKEIIYEATVNSVEGVRRYVGQTKNTFKERLKSHRNSFKYSENRIRTRLATYVWDLKDRNRRDIDINYSLVCHASKYRRGDRYCHLCIAEKTFIAKLDALGLNKRSEILDRCRHRDEHLLQNWKG